MSGRENVGFVDGLEVAVILTRKAPIFLSRTHEKELITRSEECHSLARNLHKSFDYWPVIPSPCLRGILEDICSRIPKLRPDIRLIPYLSLHEYESLLFSDPDAFADALRQPPLARRFHEVRHSFETPEDINQAIESAPSKRVTECQHFHSWLERLETLPDL
jgi:hypothetical protein